MVSPQLPCMTADTDDGETIAVTMFPEGARVRGGFGGGRALLTTKEARQLRDALTAALTIDDLRTAANEAQARLEERLRQ